MRECNMANELGDFVDSGLGTILFINLSYRSTCRETIRRREQIRHAQRVPSSPFNTFIALARAHTIADASASKERSESQPGARCVDWSDPPYAPGQSELSR